MKSLKNIMAVTVLASVLSVTASAQQYTYGGISTGAVTIAGAAAPTTNTVAFNRITLRPQTGLGIGVHMVGTSNVVISNVVLNGAVSIDGTNWSTHPNNALSLVFQGPGTTNSRLYTNLSALQVGNARYFTITNIVTSATNGSLTISNVAYGVWQP